MDSEESPKEKGAVDEPTAIEETEETEEETPKTDEPRLAKIEYDYEARDDDELSLNKGDVINVLEQRDDGWWKGDLNGKTGLFPENHVKLIPASNQSAEGEENAENSEGKKKKTLDKYGVRPGGLGSLFSGGGIPSLKKRSQPSPESSSVSEEKNVTPPFPVLRKTSFPSPESSSVSEEKNVTSPFPVLKKTSLPSPVSQQPSNPLPLLPPKKKPPKPKIEQKAEVTHDYEAEEHGEISLTSGTQVTILEKLDEDGWWRGINEKGDIGLFPSTYVKELKQAEIQQKSPPASEEVTAEEVVDETSTSEQVVDSPPSSVHSSSRDINEVYNEDSQTSPTLPVRRTSSETSSPTITLPVRRTSNETSSPTIPTIPTIPTRHSSYESSQARRQSAHELPSRRNSSHSGEEYVAKKRPPSLVSPDLPPAQSISTIANVDTTPVSPEERPVAPPRQLSKPSENKTDSQKSPTLAKPPLAKPPVAPVRRPSTKSIQTKNENSPTEPISPKINRRTSNDQYESSTTLPETEDKGDNDEQIEEVDEKHEETFVDKEAEISEEEETKDEEEVTTETVETKDDEDTVAGHEVEPEEKKPNQQLPPLPSGPKLTSLGKDRPNLKNRKAPTYKSVKETASQSQNAILSEAVASAKDEVEEKQEKQEKPSTPPKPEKPEKPVKPNSVRLPTLGAGIQLRSVAKKPSVETPTESTETTASSGIDTRPISGGVKGMASRFNQFGGIPSSSDVEFRLKKWFNEEINKVKSQFEAQLAEERSKREALEATVEEIIASLQEN